MHEPRRTYSRYAPARIRSPAIVVVASMLNGAPPQRRPFGKFPPPPPLGLVACLTRKLTVRLRVKRPVWLLTRHGRGRTPSKSWRKRVKSREADAQLRPLTVIVYGPAGSLSAPMLSSCRTWKVLGQSRHRHRRRRRR